MQYSRENFEGTEEQLRDAEMRENNLTREIGNASELEKLADVSYANVVGVLDFLRGRTAEQSKRRLEHLYDKAHDEALERDKQHTALEAQVEKTWFAFAESVNRLKRFESEKLGTAN
jgi:hypothetical protein